MVSIGQWMPGSSLARLGVAIAIILVGAVIGRLIIGPGEMRYVSVAKVESALPERAAQASRSIAAPDPAAARAAPAAGAIPAPTDLALIEPTSLGALPRIGNDGRRPVAVYARPFNNTANLPKVAILIEGLGQQPEAADAALHLAGEISLAFSVYSEELPRLFERARLAGHEVLLDLPMEPVDYPANDPGPHTLRVSGTNDANIERLTWILARGSGYVGVSGEGGAFALSDEAAPILQALAARGLALVELEADDLAARANAAGLPYGHAPIRIDADPSAEKIDEALGNLEAAARLSGTAIGVAQAYPVSLERLAAWTATLEQKGLVLAPVSALLVDQRAPQRAAGNQASNLASSD